jgi:hypothetical protein
VVRARKERKRARLKSSRSPPSLPPLRTRASSPPITKHLDVNVYPLIRILHPGSFWHPLATTPPHTQCAADRAGFPFLSPPSLHLHSHPPTTNAHDDPPSVCTSQAEAGTRLGSFPIHPAHDPHHRHPLSRPQRLLPQHVRTTVSHASPGLQHALRPLSHHAAHVARPRHQLLLAAPRAPDGNPASEPQGPSPLSTGIARRAPAVLVRRLTSWRGHASVWRCRPAHIRDAERHP